MAKIRQKLNQQNICEIDLSYLCLQKFEKFWLSIAENIFAKFLKVKQKWLYFWRVLTIWNPLSCSALWWQLSLSQLAPWTYVILACLVRKKSYNVDNLVCLARLCVRRARRTPVVFPAGLNTCRGWGAALRSLGCSLTATSVFIRFPFFPPFFLFVMHWMLHNVKISVRQIHLVTFVAQWTLSYLFLGYESVSWMVSLIMM